MALKIKDMTLTLTPAEQELIRLKREEEANKAQQDAIKEQLEYEKRLKQQDEEISKKLKDIEKSNSRMKLFYDELISKGCKEYVSLDTSSLNVDAGYIKSYIKEEDHKSESITKYWINTKWGTINEVDINNKAGVPSQISTRYQHYKASSVATKILDKINQDRLEEERKNKLNSYKEELIKQFKQDVPEGTTFEEKTEYRSSSINRGTGWYENYLIMKFPNGSWVKINYYTNNWNIHSKFDSKIQPETKEEWIKYLAKE
jgi:hypothetical protein